MKATVTLLRVAGARAHGGVPWIRGKQWLAVTTSWQSSTTRAALESTRTTLRVHSWRQQQQAAFNQCRLFSSMPPLKSNDDESSKQDSNNTDNNTNSKTLLSRLLTPQIQTYLLIGGGTVGSILVARVVVQFTSFFTLLTPLTMAKWGFYLGFGTASALAGLAVFTLDIRL